jgi:dGTP triphosphohydrolase
LRDEPASAASRDPAGTWTEVAENYRTRAAYYRAIADHIAGMTDSYCNAEYKELVG